MEIFYNPGISVVVYKNYANHFPFYDAVTHIKLCSIRTTNQLITNHFIDHTNHIIKPKQKFTFCTPFKFKYILKEFTFFFLISDIYAFPSDECQVQSNGILCKRYI